MQGYVMFRNNKSVLLSLSVCSTNFKLVESNCCHKPTYQKDPNGKHLTWQDEPIKMPVRQRDRIKVCLKHNMWFPSYRPVVMSLQMVVQATGVLILYLSL